MMQHTGKLGKAKTAGARREQGCIKLGLVHAGAGLREVFPLLYLASRFCFGNMDMAM
jgi:hypothetical protein